MIFQNTTFIMILSRKHSSKIRHREISPTSPSPTNQWPPFQHLTSPSPTNQWPPFRHRSSSLRRCRYSCLLFFRRHRRHRPRAVCSSEPRTTTSSYRLRPLCTAFSGPYTPSISTWLLCRRRLLRLAASPEAAVELTLAIETEGPGSLRVKNTRQNRDWNDWERKLLELGINEELEFGVAEIGIFVDSWCFCFMGKIFPTKLQNPDPK
ncbi:hypothetical protein D8674_006105 [Pyrus ussuriensis x Pyrus communis]|uniref:Uncharacterized protein n=1 Tax=Pyrus ussuriensis x Pyrus communis TaxID=2448454 RepID=A0A5N5FTB4_9ROSA|nr:hypothetical protein D8674_006105 [Pyrus ussuriensis x Pyrus communis]